MRSPVVITGIGAVSSLGMGTAALWAGIEQGRDGRTLILRFPTDELSVHQACLVPGFNPPPSRGDGPARTMSAQFAQAAAAEAMAMARLASPLPSGRRVAVVLGTNLVIEGQGPQALAAEVARDLGLVGPCIGVATACAASTGAVGLARELVASGLVDVALAGGTDGLMLDVLAGFHALGVLSPGVCAPFSEPSGTVLGEGAGFVVLERREDATDRGAEALAGLWGFGVSSDGFHETSPDPAGAGLARAVRSALVDGGLSPADIGYVNVHGTGTEANDAAESRGLQAVFGALGRLPVSSSKSFLGHALGAAGVLELVTSVMALQRQALPPTLNVGRRRPHSPPDLVSEGGPRPHAFRHALSTNAAFGGVNAALAFGRPEAAPPLPTPPPRRVFVLGLGAVGVHGFDLAHLSRHLAQGAPRVGSLEALPEGVVPPSADPRRQDPSSRFLCAATGLALADARISIRGALRERAGVVVGSSRLSPATADEFHRSIRERGLARVSTAAFARRVLCAPAGSCSRAFSLRGPTSTLATGRGSGLVAMLYAAQMLQERDDADLLIAGGFDERASTDAPEQGEGAACAVFGTGEAPASGIEVTGWGLAAGGETATATRQALRLAKTDPGAIELVFGAEVGEVVAAPRMDPARLLGGLESAEGAFALVAAALALREGRARTALVTSAGGATAVAVVLKRVD